VSEQTTFPRELINFHPCAVDLLTLGIKMGAGELRRRDGYWPSFAYVTVTDAMTGFSATVTFLLATTGGVIYYESLFKVQFPNSIEFIIIPIWFDGGPRCSRLQI